MAWSYFEKEAIKILTRLGTIRNKRFYPCAKCKVCLTEECGKCINCIDMCKFGGLGKRRKRCVLRKCRNINFGRYTFPVFARLDQSAQVDPAVHLHFE